LTNHPTPAEIVPQERTRSFVEASPGPSRPCQGPGCNLPLTGRQKRFHSQACNTAWWDTAHPRIGRPVRVPGARPIRQRVLTLMTDGAWRTVLEIAQALGVQPQTASAKLRDLRKCMICRRRCEKHPDAYFDVDRRLGTRPYTLLAHEYRLVLRVEAK